MERHPAGKHVCAAALLLLLRWSGSGQQRETCKVQPRCQVTAVSYLDLSRLQLLQGSDHQTTHNDPANVNSQLPSKQPEELSKPAPKKQISGLLLEFYRSNVQNLTEDEY